MRDVARELHSIRKLPVGAGALSAYGFIGSDWDDFDAGLGLNYKHRLSRRAAAFLRGEVGNTGYSAVGGLEYEF